MWAHLWPWRVEEEIPIGHITNGVHIPTWLAYPMHLLYDRVLRSDWQEWMGDAKVWQSLYNVDPGELWETHCDLKNRLLDFVRRRVGRQIRRRNEPDEAVEAARTMLDPNALTIGFARRFATYKRADLFFRQLDTLAELVNDPQRPVQLIFSGKAHPADEPGKQLIKKIENLRHDRRFAGRLAFIEDYDINVARHLVQGVDVWLNTPRRPKEASGTSGMKAVLNGGLNLSILDGWWAEAYNGKNGFAIGDGRQHVDDEITDERDAAEPHQSAPRRSDPALLRPRRRRPAAAMDPNDGRIDRHARAAVQCASHGDRLRAQVLPGSRRRAELGNEPAVGIKPRPVMADMAPRRERRESADFGHYRRPTVAAL